jgi:glycosyltransferase involved in cell wall biosynthesis
VTAAPLLIVSGDTVGARMAGPGIRAWEIARAMAGRGIEVILAVPGAAAATELPAAPPAKGHTPGPSAAGEAPMRRPAAALPAGLTRIGYDVRGDALREAARRAGAVYVQSLVLAKYPFLGAMDSPIVVDLYDPFVLENLHARAAGTASGRARGLASDRAALLDELRRGDFFVCASEVQRDFWLGLLLAAGRLNPGTYDDDASFRRLIDLLPFGIPADPPGRADPRHPVLRGVRPGLDHDSLILLWGGGLWDWFDPLTLLRAVADVARSEPRLRLVFLGTRTPSPSVRAPEMAARTRALAAELDPDGSLFHFLEGWVPYEERGRYLGEADIGVSCHRDTIEARFAFRTRLLDCIWAGLPMLVTAGDVLAADVVARGLGAAVPPGDPAALGAALRTLLAAVATDRDGFEARFFASRPHYQWARAVDPLARFVARPARAPDADAADLVTGGGPTPARALPARALELLREGGPLLLAEEAVRYVRWLQRPH